jgi:flagellar hook protein FlgE
MSSFSITETGLSAVETALNAVSDNLANAQTIGFKSQTADFETLLGQSIGTTEIGGGVTVSGVTSNFSEGSLNQTGQPLDMAIQGNGFFIYQTSAGQQVFSRDGQLTLGPNGTLLGPNGYQLLAYTVQKNGTLGALGPVQIPQSLLAPTASTTVSLSGNLNSGDPVIPTTTTINPGNSATYDYSESVTVYDSLGNAHELTFYFQNNGPDPGNPGDVLWSWTATLDGSTTGLTNNSGTFDFNSAGAMVIGSTPTNPLTATLTNGAGPLSLGLNFGKITQFASGDSVSGVADGNAPAGPVSSQIGPTGQISVTYSNGQTVPIGQVALATFASNSGLQLTTGGVYAATPSAGAVAISVPGAGAAGTIVNSSLEQSNVSVSNQLVNLVVLQNLYGANAKALQTQDNVESAIINMPIQP